jgi:mannose-6-phosphate isomerase-like protein (cupin superfamily)
MADNFYQCGRNWVRSSWFSSKLVCCSLLPKSIEPTINETRIGRSIVFMDIQNLNDAKAFITMDGSEIRELLAHRNSCIRNQSLAEARIAVGLTTQAHYHPNSEEIYYILAGSGSMVIDGETRQVGPGDAIAIPPGAVHNITNNGHVELRLLCCCAPGYEHEDTVLL